MAISSQLRSEILARLGESEMSLSRRARGIANDYGPMTGDEARWIIAHEAGIDLAKYGLSGVQIDHVRSLRSTMRTQAVPAAQPTAPRKEPRIVNASLGLSAASVFNSRSLHANVVKSSRKLFVDGHHTDALRRAFQAVNSRVKKLAKTTRDGHALMAHAFKQPDPILQMTAMSNQSETDEQMGLMFLMMGGIAALRNVCTHEEAWVFHGDQDAVLDALAFASLLHRFLDRCEEYNK